VCAISSLTSRPTFAISSPDEFLLVILAIHIGNNLGAYDLQSNARKVAFSLRLNRLVLASTRAFRSKSDSVKTTTRQNYDILYKQFL